MSKSPAHAPKTVTAMTINLRFGLADDGPNSWSERQKAFPPLFSRNRADFICVQEANNFQIDYLNEVLTDYDIIGVRKPAPRFWQNNAIFYRPRWTCTRYDHLFLSPTPTIPSRFQDSRWPRQCTIGCFRNGTTDLICVDTHFDFKPDVQARSARIIMERLDAIDPALPTIVCGDFNATPSSPCHAVFTSQQRDENMAPDRHFTNVLPPGSPGTHHGFTGKDDGRYIDWILYRGGFELFTSGILREKYADRYPSDHFPVFAEFALP